MTRLMPLCYFGNPILRKKCTPIREITDEIREIVRQMKASFSPPYDVGLSAPQVGYSLRLFLINVIGENPPGHPVFGDQQVFINPVLSEPSDQLVCLPEGCISIPGIYGDVYRPESITVEAMNLDGKIFKERVSGYRARVIMHENDHLNGVLFTDRMAPKERRKLEHALQAVKKKYSQRVKN